MKASRTAAFAALALAVCAWAADRRVDPTFLHRYLPRVAENNGEFAGKGVHYRPLFGAGDPDSGIAKALARYGELTVDPSGVTAAAAPAAEEQVYVVLEGGAILTYAGERHALRKGDFVYLPPRVSRAAANQGSAPCRIMVMGFRIPQGTEAAPPPKLLIANLDAVKKQVVGNHPPTTLYQLMIGDTKSTRDAIAAGHVLTSLYVMEFAPGGTNFPHHHETEEEAYFVLDGGGEMVAGGGQDGVEGRRPARAGDAYFFRLNCTVGFYNGQSGTAHILAARWLFPFPKRVTLR